MRTRAQQFQRMIERSIPARNATNVPSLYRAVGARPWHAECYPESMSGAVVWLGRAGYLARACFISRSAG